jgi:hypothetical protein
MRLALTAVVVIGLSAAGAAQSSAPPSMGVAPRPSIGLPLPSIGLPLPPIGLPLPPIGFSPKIDTPRGSVNSTRPAPQIEQQNRRFGQRASRRSGGTVFYFVPSFGWGYPGYPGYPQAASAPGMPSVREEPKAPTGRLRVELQPGVDPQVYIDGYYVGLLYEVNGELTLAPGPHKLELRADGYDSLEVDVQISPDRSITYRGALKTPEAAPTPVQGAAASEPAPLPPPSTIYVIPGCYIGNVPPRDAGLPADCDASRATTLQH